MTPDFAQWLLQTPQSQRSGPVFDLGDQPGRQRTTSNAGRVLGAIGEKAGVKANATKFASAHDLRRSFGTRWSSRVKPATLRALMRHASIDTTLRYYVSQDSDDIAAELWAGLGNSLGNSRSKSAVESTEPQAATYCPAKGYREPAKGVEPLTPALRMRCSAN